MTAHRVKSLLRELAPPLARRIWFALFGWRWFHGRYSTWEEAAAQATGYEQPAILERVLAATLRVREGAAAFERDGVTFALPAANWPLLAALEHVAAAAGGRLRVVDFGGALGSTYFQSRPFLPRLTELGWTVVEQAHYFETGVAEIAHGPLRFSPDLASAVKAGGVDVVLAAGVLHCLRDPEATVAEILRLRPPFVLLDVLPLQEGEAYVTVQRVPRRIYEARYPVHFFNRTAFAGLWEADYELVWTFRGSTQWWTGWRNFETTGWLLRRRGTQ